MISIFLLNLGVTTQMIAVDWIVVHMPVVAITHSALCLRNDTIRLDEVGNYRVIEAYQIIVQPNFNLLLLAGVQRVRYGSADTVMHLAKSRITHFGIKATIPVGCNAN